MEILYIYIDEYKKIKDQNINFGGKYRFHYDKRTKSLNVSENKQHIEGFYNKQDKIPAGAKITNVTSIIGENGVGKTSFLDFIVENFVSGSQILYPFICAIKINNQLEIHHFEVSIEKDNCNHYSIEKTKISVIENVSQNDKTPFYVSPRFDAMILTDFLFFSNIFDNRYEYELKGCKNLSTNFLVRNDLQYRIEMGVSDVDDSVLNIHRFEEIFRQMTFLSNGGYNKERIPFDLPNKLSIILTKNRFVGPDSLEFRLKNTFSERQILENYQIITHKISGILPSTRANNSDFIQLIVGNSFMNFLEELFSINLRPIEAELTVLSEDIKAFLINSNPQSIKVVIEKTAELISKIGQIRHSPFIGVLEKNLSFYKFLEENTQLISEFSMELFAQNQIHLEFSVNDVALFKEMSNAYSGTYVLKPYLDFEWRNLSSGEKAQLTMYSRFFTLADSESGDKLKQNLIILMDEPDTNLHPQWQKKMLNSLLEFFTEIYATKEGEQRNIQVIFTTNNPISASDLLSCNTVFMKLDSNKQMQIQDSLDDQRQTFGANIYSLYSDSFFIRDGLMGDFASEKINSVIKALNSLEDLNKEQREVMRRTILQIGEPAIKNKLIQMYSQRFQLDIHERLDKIEKKLDSDDQNKPE